MSLYINKQLSQKPPKLGLELIDSLIPRFSIAREGWLRTGIFLSAGVLTGLVGNSKSTNLVAKIFGWLSRTLLGFGLFSAYSYLDPEREPLGNAEDYFYSPSDGMVISVQHVANEAHFIDGPAYKIQISSHIFDTSIQRMPSAGRVQYIHTNTHFQSKIGLETSNGQRLLLSYRLNPHSLFVIPAPLGETQPVFLRLQAGQTLGLAEKTGVRSFGQPLLTTLFLPATGIDILVRAGQHVQAGMTVIGRITPS